MKIGKTNRIGADVVIAGGGVGGCAAALALVRAGRSVVLTEETAWIGGQLTSQAVPPDEHGWIEERGASPGYREFRRRVRETYLRNYPVLEPHRRDPYFNPGNGWVSPLCHEPRVALAVLWEMLSPFVSNGRLQVLTGERVVGVMRDGSRKVRQLWSQHLRTGALTELRGAFFVDATELGDLLPLAEMDFVTGSEARADTGEPGAPEAARPDNIQAFSHCFIVEHHEGTGAVGPAPPDYEYWRDYVPALDPPWPGKLLSWEGLHPRTMERATYRFDPHREEPALFSGLWSFRRIIDRSQFTPGFFGSDLCLVNWPMIDYLEGNLLTVDDKMAADHRERARRQSLALFHWLQTEAPRPDGGQGWPGLRLCAAAVGTRDGLAMAPYIRESRRIRALHTITEQEVSASCRPDASLGQSYEDSVGIGYYRIDLHPTSGGDNYFDVPSLPFQIPLRALIPQQMDNLLPAAKNIGTTHITNGCYRLQPVEWNIGEAVGTLLHYCLDVECIPADVCCSAEHLRRFQGRLCDLGFELAWPEDLRLEDGDPHAHASRRAGAGADSASAQ